MFIWWGPELIQFYNDAYRRLMGPENHPSALGQGGAECWPQIWDIIGPQIDHVMGGRGATWHENQMIPLTRNGRTDQTYWTYSYGPIDEAGVAGGVGGVLAVCAETTKTVNAEMALRRSQARQEFRIALGDAFLGLDDPAEIMAAVAERIGLHLGVDHANYYTIDGDAFMVEREWRSKGTPSLVGRTRLSDFGEPAAALARSGAVLRLDDTRKIGEAEAFAAVGMIAVISAPVHRDGRWVAGLHVHQREPRVWTDDEAALVIESAQRAWSAVERARAAASLIASEAKYRALVTGAGPIMFRAAPDGNMIEAPGWEARTGQNLSDYQGFGWLDAVHPDDQSVMMTRWAASLASGEPIRIQYRTRAPDGQWRWAEGYAVAVRGNDGTVAEWVGTVTDIQDQRAAEQALRESEERFRLLAETIQETFYITDIDKMQLLYLSPAFEKTWGRPVEWLMEDVSRLMSTIHPEDRAAMQAARIARFDGSPAEIEFRIARPDGSERWILDRTFPMRVEGVRWSAGLAEDITERKRAEAALLSLNQTLEQRVAAELAERLKTEEALRQSQKLEAIGQLTGGVAHDFNNLLTIIRSSADLLRSPALTEDRRRRFVDAIADTADRAAKLTAQLLAFSRRQALSPRVFDLAERMMGIEEMIQTVLGPRIALELEIAERPALVEADINQFETALVNLAANARDAMDGQGTLSIRLFRADHPLVQGGDLQGIGERSRLAVSLADTGCGIQAERLGRVFEPFYTTKEIGRGTGLGLSQVYGFAHQSGGEVTVESAPGQGATFTIYLPRAEKPLSKIEAEAPSAGLMQPAGGCVLVVDDNPEVGEFSTQLLEELGYNTVLAANAEEALKLLDNDPERFDLIFSDVVMPGMDGIALGLEVRRRRPDMPFILTSGYSHALAEDGAHGFDLLQKPYSAEDLARILRRTKTNAKGAIKIAAIV